MLVNVRRLITNHYTDAPDPGVALPPAEQVAFGTSCHCMTASKGSFNEGHIFPIARAICLYRRCKSTDGPIFLGIDTHAVSIPLSG